MRGFSFLLATVASGLRVKGDGNIKDVIVTLQTLLKQAQSESGTIDKDYDEVACSCRDTTRRLVRESEDVREYLEGKIVDKKAKDEDVEGAELAVSNVDTEIVGLKGDIKDLSDAISTKRAECKERLKSAEEVISACDQVLNQFLTQGVQSKQIVGMVKKMRTHAADKKSELEGDGCVQTVLNDEQAKAAASGNLKIAQDKKVQLDAKLAEEQAAQAQLGQEIKDGKLQKDILDNDLKVEKARCENAAAAYDAHSALLSNEITGLVGAVEALKKAADVKNPEKSPSAFIQFSNIADTARVLGERANALHSHSLATVALQLKFAQKKVDFRSVLTMINKMIKNLQEEELAEMSKTQYCADTLEALKKAKDGAQDAYNAAETAVSTLEVQIKRAEKSHKQKSAEKEANNKQIDENNKTLQDQVSSFEKQLSDSERAEQAVQSALDFLNLSYGSDNQAQSSDSSMVKVKARNSQGGSAVKLLTKLLGDFAQDADIGHMETSCAASATYTARRQANGDNSSCEPDSTVYGIRMSIEDLETENEILTHDIQGLDVEIKQKTKDHDSAMQTRDLKLEMLDVAKQERATRQAACVNAEDTYEARKARREEEVKSLQEALSILQNHVGEKASFLAMVKKSV